MNVKEVMSREIRTIRMVDRLDAAARVMWEHDCGIVPVVDGNQAVVGVLTDRDVCMATYTQGRPLTEIAATAVMARQVRSCKPDDALATALALMQQHQVHRLPVVDARGVVVGILAVNDLVRLAHARPAAIDAPAVLKTLATIGAPRRAANAPAAAGTAPVTPGKPVPAAVGTAAVAAAAPAASGPVAIPPPAATILPVAANKPAKPKDGGKGKGKGRKN
jgi:CBS domain-containing protein